MKRVICTILTLMALCSLCLGAQDNTHAMRHEQLLKQPRTVLREAREAVDVALKEGNSPHLIDALMQLSAAQLLIDTDSIGVAIGEVQRVMYNCDNPVDRSVVAIYLCELYSYCLQNDYDAHSRIYIAHNPNIATWNVRNYQEAVDSLCRVALQPQKSLRKTPLSHYRSVITTDENDTYVAWKWVERFYPTMYDFVVENVCRFVDDNSLKLDWINEALTYHKKRTPVRLLLDIKKLELQGDDEKVKIAVLDSLITHYERYDYVIEAVLAREALLPVIIPDSTDAQRQHYNDLQRWIARYPKYYRTDCLRAICSDLSSVAINVSHPFIIHPQDSVKIEVSYRNVGHIGYEIYRCLDIPANGFDSRYAIKEWENARLERKGVIQLNDSDTLTFLTRQRCEILAPLPAGVYKMQLHSGGETTTSTFVVTPYMLYSIGLGNNETAALVVDCNSGKPIEGQRIKLLSPDGTVLQTAATDSDGMCRFVVQSASYRNSIVLDNIALCPLRAGAGYVAEHRQTASQRLQLFTDRSIYRPGQELQFSVLLYQIGSDIRSVLPGEQVVLQLRDASYNTVWQDTLTTDSFGTAAGSVVLPIEAAMGNWHFGATAGDVTQHHSIMVSEYKRPRFYVECDSIEGMYVYGDTIEVSGRAISYSGVPVPFASVRYTVQHSSWYGGYGEKIVSDSTTTDAEGRFRFRFVTEKPENELWREWGSRYITEVVVTSSAGESQSNIAVVSVSGTAVMFRCTLPTQVCKETVSPFEITMVNSEGTLLQLPLCVDLYALHTEGFDTPLGMLRKSDESIWHKDYPAGVRSLELPYTTMSSGAYRLIMSTCDSAGILVCDSIDFVFYSQYDTIPPVPTALWLPITEQTVNDNETAMFLVGSSYKDASLLCIVKEGCHIVDVYRVSLDNETKPIELLYKPSYGGAVSINVILVREKKMYHQQLNIYRRQPDTRLTITPATFRDKTLSGSLEKWQFTVRDAQGNPVEALFMAEMYDASLDALYGHQWSLYTHYTPYVPYVGVMRNYNYNSDNDYMHYGVEYTDAVCRSIPTPLLYTYLVGNRNNRIVVRSMAGGRLMNKYAATTANFELADASAMVEESAVQYDALEMSTDELVDDSEILPATPIEYRTNMQETAFFYPHLVTDLQGKVKLEFTVPESNTTWNFFSLAFTRNLYSGQYINRIISSKPLMVSPNIPRFLRQNDETVLSVVVQNTTNEPLTGTAMLSLYNPEYENILEEQSCAINITANGETTLYFHINVPDTLPLLGLRVGVSTPMYSDGEQHLIGILPATQLITETCPFFLSSSVNDTTILFAEMQSGMQRPSVNNYRVTLEYCDNPAWYAVTALPALSTPVTESVTDCMAALYANTVAAGIIRQNPNIVLALKEWNKSGKEIALTSQLMQNEELKQLILSQTPWTLDAVNSTEQMQQLVLLLDSVKVADACRQSVEKLKELQCVDGGWSWFKTMPTSYDLTLYILKNISRLKEWGETKQDEALAFMIVDALRYIDAEYINRNKDNTNRLSYSDLLYLYVRSAHSDIPMSDNLLSLYRRHIAIVQREWYKYNELEKAYIAIILHRSGYIQDAAEVINSLREYATTTAGEGMFWANNRSTAYNHSSAIQVHCAIYEAFEQVSYNRAELDAMRQWLLLQKQSQMWYNVPSTLDAISILLTSGSNWLTTGLRSQLIWGDNPLPQMPQTEQILGYEKYSRLGSEIDTLDATLTIENHNEQPSWGAIYWQYYDSISNVESQASDNISISRQYFVQREGQWLPVDSTTLCVGDEVLVYLHIYTARDMQFMVLNDNRPACFEPLQQLSKYGYSDGLWYYSVPSDASNTFYFDYLPKGTHIVQYKVYVDRVGTYQAGVADIQSYYAPQYVSHTSGARIIVQER